MSSISHLHLFGGGPLTLVAVEIARKHHWDVSLRTSPRLWNPQATWASALTAAQVPVHIHHNLNAVMSQGASVTDGAMALSFGAPWIFNKEWIESWKGKAFNVHGRPLPLFRGGGGASWLIMMNQKEGMAAIHQLTPGVDDGAIVASRRFTYPPDSKDPQSFDAIDIEMNAALLRDWLPRALTGEITYVEQDHSHSTYWPRLSTQLHGWVDWTWNADDIVRFCQSFGPPYGGARTYLRQEIVRMGEVRKVSDKPHHPFQAGLIFRLNEKGYFVATNTGALLVSKIESTNPVKGRVGDRFMTPRSVLEKSLATRVQYLPDGTITQDLSVPEESL